MRSWLQKNFQSMMSSKKSNRKKGDVSLLDLTPKELPFLHDTSLQKFQDFLHSPISLTRSYIVLQYHWSTLCMWEVVGPQFPLWLCDGDYIMLFSLYKLKFLFVMKPKAIWCYWRCWPDIRHPNFQSKNKLVVCKTKVPSKLMEFSNPYNPEEDNKVFMIICPSHQLNYPVYDNWFVHTY